MCNDHEWRSYIQFIYGSQWCLLCSWYNENPIDTFLYLLSATTRLKLKSARDFRNVSKVCRPELDEYTRLNYFSTTFEIALIENSCWTLKPNQYCNSRTGAQRYKRNAKYKGLYGVLEMTVSWLHYCALHGFCYIKSFLGN